MSRAAPRSNRECNCPVCVHDNGGLNYCARCRFNDCEPDNAYCGQEDAE